MKRHLRICLVLILALAGGCASPDSNEAARLSQQDSPEAVLLKAALLEAPGLAGSAIDVTIDDDKIVLSGFVETSEQRAQAERIVRETGDAGTVVNQIIVK